MYNIYLERTTMSSKAGMAVFACLALRHLPLYRPRKILDMLVADEEVVWRRWKELVILTLEGGEPVEFSEEERRWEGLDEAENSRLSRYLGEAIDAYRMQGWQPENAEHETIDVVVNPEDIDEK